MNYHLKKDCDLMDFLKKVTLCKHQVFYETKEGDLLELHSSFCRYIFGNLTGKSTDTGIIRLEHPDDFMFLEPYLSKAEPVCCRIHF